MSWALKKKAQALLASEEGTIRKDWGGKVSVALVYPNTYAVGMSNLGFQTIYWHLNQRPDVVCERVFLADHEDQAELARTSGGTSASPSPAAITSANSASGSGFTNVTAPPIITSGS